MQVLEQEPDELRGDRDDPAGAAGAVFQAAGLAWRAVSGPGPRGAGQGSGERQLSRAAILQGARRGVECDGFGGAQCRVVQAVEYPVSSGQVLVTSARTAFTSAGVAARCGPAGPDDLGGCHLRCGPEGWLPAIRVLPRSRGSRGRQPAAMIPTRLPAQARSSNQAPRLPALAVSVHGRGGLLDLLERCEVHRLGLRVSGGAARRLRGRPT